MTAEPVDVVDEDGPWTHARCLCVRCEHRWIAVFPVSATVLECPSCGVFAGIPDDQEEGT